MILGYARVSTRDQNLDGQRDALTAAGAERIFADTITGTARVRPELDRLLTELRSGDVVVVTKYDRLARSLKDLLEIVDLIRSRGAGFRSLGEDIDTTTPAESWCFMFSHRSPSLSGSGSWNGPVKVWRRPGNGAGSGVGPLPSHPPRRSR
jgi:DNA invertase Pin-like site-specific DNA recombinase